MASSYSDTSYASRTGKYNKDGSVSRKWLQKEMAKKKRKEERAKLKAKKPTTAKRKSSK